MAGGAVEARRVIFDQSQQPAGSDGHVQIAQIDSIYGRGEKILLHIGWSHAAFRPDVERPAVRRPSLVDHGALDALVDGADEHGQRASPGVTRASDSLLID